MPFSLHPSGYCVWFSESNGNNLTPGYPCPDCNRIAGHSVGCPAFVYREDKGKSSRPKLFNATSILWAQSKERSFITFTLPSLQNGIYQKGVDCPDTGDLAIARKFSKTLEAYSLREKRRGSPMSYTWVAEAQMSRQAKYGGIGDLHYHLIVNKRIKEDGGRLADPDTLNWLQNLWCSHIGVDSNNCVHVDPLPDGIDSIPSYVSKYLGKGSQRMILSRQFQCSRDLSRFKPITLKQLPDCKLIRSHNSVTPSGFEVSMHYFKTSEVLEQYGLHMLAEGRLSTNRGSGRSVTKHALNLDAVNAKIDYRNTPVLARTYPEVH